MTAEKLFKQIDESSGTYPTHQLAFCASLREFKDRVDDVYRKIEPQIYQDPLDIAKKLHDIAYSSWRNQTCSGYIGWKLGAIWFESKYRNHPEPLKMHKFLEKILDEIDPIPDYDSITYQRLSPISDKWRFFQRLGELT